MEVVGQALVVVEEILLDHVASIAEAEDEVIVTEVRVVRHQGPDDRTVPDVDHRLGDRLRMLPEASTQPAAEQHNFQGSALRAPTSPWRYQATVAASPSSSGVIGRQPRAVT